MSLVIAAAILCVLGAIALAHAYWATGGVWPARDGASLARAVIGDGRARMPPPVACLLAAAAIAVAAVWPMLLVATATAPPPRAVIVGVGAAIAVVFLLRGVAGYLPAWRRRFATEPFAMRDITLFSPLCFIIAAGYGALLLPGVVK